MFVEILNEIVVTRFADFRHIRIAKPGPQAVGAGQQDIPGLERPATRDAHIRHRSIPANTALDKIAHRMVLRLLLRDRAFLDQDLHMTVIA